MEDHAALRRVRAESAHSEARSEAGDEDRSLRERATNETTLRTLRQDTTKRSGHRVLGIPGPQHATAGEAEACL